MGAIAEATVRISDDLAATPAEPSRVSVSSELLAGLTFLARNRDQRLITVLVGLGRGLPYFREIKASYKIARETARKARKEAAAAKTATTAPPFDSAES